MLWVGLTGAMGSGKSTVAQRLREKGFPVLDADQVVHDLLRPGTAVERELLKTFGQVIKGADGHLDRRALGRVVFGDKKKLARLEAILHPKVRQEVARLKLALAKTGSPVAFYDVPLLFEKNMEPQFDFIVVVSADDAARRARIQSRMNLSLEDILAREKNHVSPKIKSSKASAVIKNNSGLDSLSLEIDRALEELGISSPAVRDS